MKNLQQIICKNFEWFAGFGSATHPILGLSQWASAYSSMYVYMYVAPIRAHSHSLPPPTHPHAFVRDTMQRPVLPHLQLGLKFRYVIDSKLQAMTTQSYAKCECSGYKHPM